ncbi:MAG: apolipoprotein N-acyltransferase [Nocardioides sp.]
MVRRLLVCVLAGLSLAAASPPVGWLWLVPLALAALFWCLLSVEGARLHGRGLLLGLAFGAAFQFTLLWWMRAVDLAAWVGLAGIETVALGLLGAAAVTLRRLPGSPAWLAVGWMGVEVVRSQWPFSGMPWGRLGFAVADTPLESGLAWFGVNGVGLLLALAGALLAALLPACRPVRRPVRRLVPAACLLGVVALALLPALAPYPVHGSGHLDVAAVQGNVPGDGTDILLDYRQVTRNHLEATQSLARDVAAGRVSRPDLVVWPENSTAVDPFADPGTAADISAALAAVDVPILVGAIVDDGPHHVLNQGIVWDPQTGAGDRYTKHHPVPFGEYIPWRGVFGSHFGQLNQVSRDMVSGTRTEPLRVAGTTIADAICFDIAYDDLDVQIRNGAQLLVVQTSNAMFSHTVQLEQQFEITRMRAIETGRYVVIASTNGITGIIAPDGTVLDTLPRRTQGYVERQVGLSSRLTPAMLVGPWVGRGCVVLTALGLLAGLVLYPRARPLGIPPTSQEASSDHLDRTPV